MKTNDKLIGFLFCMLLMCAAIIPVAGTMNFVNNNMEDLGVVKELSFINEDDHLESTGNDVDWWPMFRHDASHTGYSTSDAPDTNNVLWEQTQSYTIWYSSPAVVDNRVYVGTIGPHGMLCINSVTGEIIWSFSTDEPIEFAYPTIYDDEVYIGSDDWNVWGSSTGLAGEMNA